MVADVARLTGHVEFDVSGGVRSLREWDSALSKSARQAEQETERVARSGRGLGDVFGSISKTATAFGAAQVGVAGAQAALSTGFNATVVAAASYEKQLNILQAVSGATAAQMDAISAKAVALGDDISLPGVSARNAALSMTELAKAGLSVNDTLAAAKGVLQLSAAGQIENAVAAEIAANALQSFDLAGDQAVRVADLLAAAANASSADVTDLAAAMGQASAVFHTGKQSIEDLTVGIGLLANAGIKGSDAGTSLKTMLLSLMAPTSQASGEMAKYGINVRNAQGEMRPMAALIDEFTTKIGRLGDAERDAALKTIFGTDAFRAASIVMLGGTQQANEMREAVTKKGAAAELAAAQMKGLAGSTAALQSQLETLALQAGQQVTPALAGMAQGVSKALTSETFATFAAGLSGITQGVGVPAQTFMSLPGPIQAATVGALGFGKAVALINAHPLAAALTAAGLAMTLLVGKWQEGKKAAEELNQLVMSAGASALQTYVQALRNIETAGGGAAEKMAFLKGSQTDLMVAYSEGNRILGEAKAKYDELKRAHGESSVQAEAQKKIVEDLRQSQINLYGSLQVVNGAVRDGGESLLRQADAAGAAKERLDATAKAATDAAAATDELRQASGSSVVNIELLAEALGISAKKAQELSDPLGSAVSRIDELTGAMTSAEYSWDRQTKALESVGASVKAMHASINPGQMREWADRAHEMADSSGVAAPKVAELHKHIETVAKGGPAAEAALKRINEIIDESKGIIEPQAEATRDYAAAQGALAKEGLGLGGALTSLKDVIASFIEMFTVSMGRIPASAKEAMTLTEDAVKIDLSKPGADAALSWAFAYKGKTPEISGAASEAAQAALAQMSIDQLMQIRGSAAGQAFASGLIASKAMAEEAARIVAMGAVVAMDRQIGYHSPPTEFIKRGDASGKAFADSLRDTASLAAKAGEEVGEQAVGGLAAGVMSGNRAIREWHEEMARAEPRVLGLAAGMMRAQQATRAWYEEQQRLMPTFSMGMTMLRDYDAGARRLANDIMGLDVEIAALKANLAFTEPYSAERAEIEKQIQFLEGWKNQLTSVAAAQEAQRRQMEANRSALDGLNAAQERSARAGALQGQVGATGLSAGQALWAALAEDTASSGENVLKAADDLLKRLVALGVPNGVQLGNRFLEAAVRALRERTPEAVQAALDILREADAAVQAQAHTLAGGFGAALDAALNIEGLKGSMGDKLAQLIQAATRAAEEQTPAATAAFANLSAGILTELERLPTMVTGTLVPEFRAAMVAFANDPSEANLAILRGYSQQAGAILSLVPKDFAKLPPLVQKEIGLIARAVQNGEYGIEEGRDRINAVISLIPRDFAKLPPAVQASIIQIVEAVRTGALSIEAGVDQIGQILEDNTNRVKRESDEVKAELDRNKAAWDAYFKWFQEHGFDKSPGLAPAHNLPTPPSTGGAPSGGGGGGGGGDADMAQAQWDAAQVVYSGYSQHGIDLWNHFNRTGLYGAIWHPSMVPEMWKQGHEPKTATIGTGAFQITVNVNGVFEDKRELVADIGMEVGRRLQRELQGVF